MVFLYAVSLTIKQQFDIGYGDLLIILYYYVLFLELGMIELLYFPRNIIRKEFPRKVNKKLINLFIFIIFIIFVMNIDSFILALSNPRLFYTSNRIGGGLIYFIFIPLLEVVYFVCIARINYSKRFSLLKAICFTLAVCGILYIFGQKGNLVTICFLFLTTFYYKCEKKNKNILVIRMGLLFAIGILIVFVLYSSQQFIKTSNVLLGLARYSDYLSNFNLLVERLKNFSYGTVFLEDEFMGYIPRFIWADKPTLYGSLKLGLEIPSLVEWTKALTGAPSFGPLGQCYADFGVFGILLTLLIRLFFGIQARKYEIKLRNKYNFFDHFLFLTFGGCLIFNITLTTFPLYQLFVIVLLVNFSGGVSIKKIKTKYGIMEMI